MSGSWVGVYQPLMGTSVEIHVGGDDEPGARAAEAAVVAEVERLTAVFSVYDPTSELSRWRLGELDDVSADLTTGLALAERWFHEGAGAFHPVCRAPRHRWRRAADEGVVPSDSELRSLAVGLRELPFLVGGRAGTAYRDGTAHRDGTAYVRRVGDCTGVDLDAMVKGHIVDRAVERGLAVPGVRSLVVNAGGDLRHAGAGAVTVGIEDPHRPYDNAEPLTRVTVSNAAVATSGTVHRGFQVGAQWFGHVLDPATGWPVRHPAAATVIAPDVATADAVATVVLVRPPDEALAFVDAREGLAALLVGPDSRVLRSGRWPTDR